MGDGANDPETVSYLMTSALVAGIFGIDPLKVGADVVRERSKRN